MMEERKERVSISLYHLTIRLIDEEATRQNRSRSNLIETILQRYLGLEEKGERISRLESESDPWQTLKREIDEAT